jgi:hypothetical protein
MTSNIGKRVFISYSHVQGAWVRDRLYPVLKAGGAEVLIDVKRFQAGVAIYQQMDATQDQAEVHLLVLSPDYLASAPCRHEMERAIATDPTFAAGSILPVVRVGCPIPPEIKGPNPLYINLEDDSEESPWDLLTSRCGVDLGASAAEWLRARQRVHEFLLDGQSVNLLVSGKPGHRALFEQLREDFRGLAVIDLESGSTSGRQNLISEILTQLGSHAQAGKPPHDLLDLDRFIKASPGQVRVAFRHFDVMARRRSSYKGDFFDALRHLVDQRKLALLIESRSPFVTLLPSGNSLSTIQAKTVELRGR